eukprot:CAMPEP_0183718420 /NCGR_PEP_ID=MMETSP0737-20130205/11680_1 /TAXON_ID=385413 /ORGANISM="Thalassiosira miniscula, Strain CCMP1093" /LENGTH=488 /DNA_ID=CAMNT_0025947975 /DNA_START=55 /DNA_END=1521 /DNA_ORIENTATION=-
MDVNLTPSKTMKRRKNGIQSLLFACTFTQAASFAPCSLPSMIKKSPRSSFQRTKQASSTAFHSAIDRGYDTPINIEETAPRDIATLEEWAYNYGIQRCPSYQLAYDATTTHTVIDNNGDMVYDVYASTSADLPAGSPVLCVPNELILSSSAAMDELRTHDMDQAEKILNSLNAEGELRQYYLMVKILVEYEKGMESVWFPWLNSLPRYFTNAASMTPFCCLCLPSLMRKLAVKERGNMSRLSVSSIKLIPFLNEDTKYDVNLCEWVYQIVHTRAFEAPDGDMKIVPMGDMFNHGSDYTEIETSYDENGNYYAYTTYDVPAGSPLRISYADPTNPSFLFARYGFLDETTPATFCKLIPPHINKDMEQLGYAENRMLFYKTGDISDEVWDILLYQHLSSTKISDRRELMRAHQAEDYAAKQMLHEKYYHETSRMLLEHIDGFIEQLDKLSGKAEDRKRNIDDHPRLPLILAHNQFVRDTFMTVRNRYFGY